MRKPWDENFSLLAWHLGARKPSFRRNDLAQRREDRQGKREVLNKMSNELNVLKLRTLLGDYPNTLALKKSEVRPTGFVFDFADVKVPNMAFKDVVRHLKYDVAELAIVTYLQARA